MGVNFVVSLDKPKHYVNLEMVNLGAEFNPLQNLTLEQFSEEVLRETTITSYRCVVVLS